MAQAVSSFADMAQVRSEDVKIPLLPVGTYRWEIFELPTEDGARSGFGQNLKVKIRCVAAADNFENPDALAAFEDEFGDYIGAVRTINFYFPTGENPNSKSTKPLAQQQIESMNRIMKFFEKICGLSEGTYEEYKVNCVNAQLLYTVSWEADEQNPGEFIEKMPDPRQMAPLA